jgi:hypothetical protein
MPDHGSLTLSDVKTPTLTIVCSPCSRLERYDVARLIAQHGNAKLTEPAADARRLPEGALRQHP